MKVILLKRNAIKQICIISIGIGHKITKTHLFYVIHAATRLTFLSKRRTGNI